MFVYNHTMKLHKTEQSATVLSPILLLCTTQQDPPMNTQSRMKDTNINLNRDVHYADPCCNLLIRCLMKLFRINK